METRQKVRMQLVMSCEGSCDNGSGRISRTLKISTRSFNRTCLEQRACCQNLQIKLKDQRIELEKVQSEFGEEKTMRKTLQSDYASLKMEFQKLKSQLEEQKIACQKLQMKLNVKSARTNHNDDQKTEGMSQSMEDEGLSQPEGGDTSIETANESGFLPQPDIAIHEETSAYLNLDAMDDKFFKPLHVPV